MKTMMIAARRMLAACGLMMAVAAPLHAEVISFDSVAPVALLGGESVLDGAYLYTALESPLGLELGLQTGTGAILDPNDPGTCVVTACPGGSVSQFYAGLNDGGMKLGRADGHAFQLIGFEFAFLAPQPMIEPLSGQLLLTGTRSSGGVLELALDFSGQDAQGDFMFSFAAPDALQGVDFSSVSFSACLFLDGACVNSLEQSAFNQAQFALDNIVVSAVPEPGAWVMLAAGLGLLALLRRRAAFKRGLLALTLLLGAAHSAHAGMATIHGDTTGASTYLRTSEYNEDDPWRGATNFLVYDVYVPQDVDMINLMTTCMFDCSMFFYQGSFDPLNPKLNFMAGDDNYVAFNTAAMGGGLWAGHYSLVITGNQAGDVGYFVTAISSTGEFTVTAVPEPSAWMMLLAGLALTVYVARRRAGGSRALRLMLAAGVLAAGVSQPARADIAVIEGDTTWGDTFYRPGDYGSAYPRDYGLDVAYRAYNFSVDSTDWMGQTFTAVCEFDCAMFLYHDAFDPARPFDNIMTGSAKGASRMGFEGYLDPHRNYVLVMAGFYDYDWGRFTMVISSGGAIAVSAVPEPAGWTMLLLGLAAVGGIAQRRRQA